MGEHDLQDKRWMYEESQRMPFIVRDPRCPYKGAKSDLMINNIDFAPTLIEMVGGKEPSYMDGKSFASVFEGKKQKTGRMLFTTDTGCNMIHHDVPARIGIRTETIS